MQRFVFYIEQAWPMATRPLLIMLAPVMALVLMSRPLMAEGDPERGRELASTCTGCHGIPDYKNVYPTYSVPKVGGQNFGYIVAALKAYRAGDRRHPTMQAQANTLSDQDIQDVAAYFVSLVDPVAEIEPDDDT